MTKLRHTNPALRWPVRIAAGAAASTLLVVGYLSDLGGTTAPAARVREVKAATQAPPTTAAMETTTTTTARAAAPTWAARAKPPASQTRPTPDGAVLAWLDAIGSGDVKTAAALVGPKSRRYIESLGGNIEGLMRESQEGYGPWARTADRSTTEVDLGVVDGAAATIVVVTGTPRGEGREGFSSDAIPAVRTSEGWMVEPTAFRSDTGGRLELVNPTRNSDGSVTPLRPHDAIVASAPGTGDFFFSLDDQPVTRVAGERRGGGARATWDPAGDMATHRHLLVVAYADGDTLTAFAGVFDVE